MGQIDEFSNKTAIDPETEIEKLTDQGKEIQQEFDSNKEQMSSLKQNIGSQMGQLRRMAAQLEGELEAASRNPVSILAEISGMEFRLYAYIQEYTSLSDKLDLAGEKVLRGIQQSLRENIGSGI